jgi:predicted transcriptional regulator
MDPTEDPAPPRGQVPTATQLREARRKAGLTVGDLARRAKVFWVQVRDLEAGLPVAAHVLPRVLTALGKGGGGEQ